MLGGLLRLNKKYKFVKLVKQIAYSEFILFNGNFGEIISYFIK